MGRGPKVRVAAGTHAVLFANLMRASQFRDINLDGLRRHQRCAPFATVRWRRWLQSCGGQPEGPHYLRTVKLKFAWHPADRVKHLPHVAYAIGRTRAAPFTVGGVLVEQAIDEPVAGVPRRVVVLLCGTGLNTIRLPLADSGALFRGVEPAFSAVELLDGLGGLRKPERGAQYQ